MQLTAAERRFFSRLGKKGAKAQKAKHAKSLKSWGRKGGLTKGKNYAKKKKTGR